MAGTTIWKGYIHFGDTDVAVKLHSAVREERVRFHLLHARDQARLRQQMVCAFEKKPVPADEQRRGFEVSEGKFIIIDPEELETATPEAGRMIDVREFVRTGQIDPFYLDHAYYLEPDAPGKGYSALAAALNSMDVAGICTWTMRKRTYLGALQAIGKTLRLNTLRHADEVLPVKALGLKSVPVTEKELKIGSDLINQLTAPFDPQKFRNEHQEKLQDMIERKARGEKIALLAPRRLKATEPDKLLAALEASLKKAV